MKAEEIKYKVEMYNSLHIAIVNDKEKLEESFKKTLNSYNDSAKKLREEIFKLRNICKHKYKGKPTVMGKGICVICGQDDY